jgi:AhpD family alkylhydroperoxidase
MRFPAHNPDTATGKASDLLGDIVTRTGSAGTMVRTMAGSPSVLGGYLELSKAMKRSRLDRAISERISLAVQARLGCALCLQAHTAGARAVGVSDTEIELAKQGTSADPTIAAIVAYGQKVDTDPSSVTPETIDELRVLGYRDRDLLDVVALVALNVLTGTFNLVTGLQPETLAATA